MASPKRALPFFLSLLLSTPPTNALPSIALPFNAQVPTVARVGENYTFQFSASTFYAPPPPETSSSDPQFTYTLAADAPPWLRLDSFTRTLSGAPSSADAGAATFTLAAADADGVAYMACTLVVSADPAPQLEGDVAGQLARTANLSSRDPAVVALVPGREFSFRFERTSFIDIVSRRRLMYYATLADHTPLPAWLGFDAGELAFSGTAPELSAFPQSWGVQLIASDVEGFAGARAGFEIAVRREQLVFVPQEVVVDVAAGRAVKFEGLKEDLFLNGTEVPMEAVASAKAEGLPVWLSFDEQSLALTGSAPEDAKDTNVTVAVTDAFGNKATATVVVKVNRGDGQSLFAGDVGTLTAKAGEGFEYYFADDLFANPDVDVQVLLPATARWLKFDDATRTLSGQVPEQTTASTLEATVTAKSADSLVSDSQDFSIRIQPVKAMASRAAGISSSSIATPSATSTPGLATSDAEGPERLSRGAIAGIAVGGLAALAILAALLFICCRRRRRRSRDGYVETNPPTRRTISRPILPADSDAIWVTQEVDTDIEKTAGSRTPATEAEPQMPQEPPPQIALDLPTQPTKSGWKWSKRFSRISQVSSIGNGEDAIRADTDIPEWGRDSRVLHTPHDSFSVQTEMARSSRQLSADLSPSKRALNRLSRLRHHRQSQQSVGLGIDTSGAGYLPRHSSRGARGHRRARSSMGMSTVMDGSSLASISTRGTSVLSARASDFPRPGAQSMFGSRSAPGLTASEKRKSIRMVDRSDSVADNRSMHEKRQSFIRNRASTSFASPLFAHGSRASSNPLQNSQTSREASSAGSQHRSARRGKSQLTTYSESSSLEPQQSRKDSRRLSQRVRSAFAPSFPRAVTRSTLGIDEEASGTSSGFETYSSSDSEAEPRVETYSDAELRAELSKPRHQRNWVVPGEASPTPPPVAAPPTSWQHSNSRLSTQSYTSRDSEPRRKWKDRLRSDHSSSPLSQAVAVPISLHDRSPSQMAQHKRNRLSEPISLVSSDSLRHKKGHRLERPRLVQTTSSRRPVSVEKVEQQQRLSSLKAETEDSRPGSETWEAMELAGLMPPSTSKLAGTGGSDRSGPAFI